MCFFSNQFIIHYKKPLGKANLQRKTGSKKEARREPGFREEEGGGRQKSAGFFFYRLAATKALTARTSSVQNTP